VTGAVNLMKTRIRLLAQLKPMRSIIYATEREQRRGARDPGSLVSGPRAWAIWSSNPGHGSCSEIGGVLSLDEATKLPCPTQVSLI